MISPNSSPNMHANPKVQTNNVFIFKFCVGNNLNIPKKDLIRFRVENNKKN